MGCGDLAAKEAFQSAKDLNAQATRLKAMLQLAASIPGMSVANDADLDTDPWLMGVQNGTLDLRTGELLPPDPAYRITRSAGCAFDPDAQCPQFLEVLNDALGGDSDMIRYFQRMLGHILTGSVREEKLFFWMGKARSGKSLLSNVVVELMGDYAITTSSETFAARRDGGGNQARDDVARMSGARLISANETSAAQFFDDALIKSLVSTERITARFSYGRPFEFLPTAKIILRGNNQPGVRDASDGFWRRMDVIEFEHQVEESRVVPDLHLRIIGTELPGILNWALAGCLEWQRIGLATPAKVRAAGHQYREDTDVVGQWIEESTTRCTECRTPATELYNNYKQWAQGQGTKPMTHAAFGRELHSRGFKRVRMGTVRGLEGLRLVPPFPGWIL